MPSKKLKLKRNPRKINFSFEAIGTRWQIDVDNAGDALRDMDPPELLKRIQKRIEVFDFAYSRFRSDSLVTKMSRQKGRYLLPDDAEVLIALYHRLYELTDGAFTPLIGQVMTDAGYDDKYSLQSHPLRKPPDWEKVIRYDAPYLTLREPALLDFGAAGKGYLIDLVGEVLEEAGVETFCIDAGGDIVVGGTEKVEIGLEHPLNFEQVIGVATISNQSICGSAGNRRKWGEFHHIIDPRVLKSPQNILTTWVVADTGLLADGLATCLFLVPAQKLIGHFPFEYAVVYKDLSLEKSKNFPAEFFVK